MKGRLVKPSRGGYTLVELLIVVAILGIAGAIVVPHMLAGTQLGVQAAARVVIADLLFAQNEAVARQAIRGLHFDVESDTYVLLDEDDQPVRTQWRTGGSPSHRVDFQRDRRFHGVQIIEVNFDDAPTIRFNELGEPQPTGGGWIRLRHEDRTYRIEVGSFTGRVTVEKE